MKLPIRHSDEQSKHSRKLKRKKKKKENKVPKQYLIIYPFKIKKKKVATFLSLFCWSPEIVRLVNTMILLV